MGRNIVTGAGLPKTPPTYSNAVKAAGLVFVSGTAPTDPAPGKIVGITIQEQPALALRFFVVFFAVVGTSLEKAVSATVILADEDDFAGMNEEWVKWFPSDPPERQGAKLPGRVPGLKVSIAMIAEG